MIDIINTFTEWLCINHLCSFGDECISKPILLIWKAGVHICPEWFSLPDLFSVDVFSQNVCLSFLRSRSSIQEEYELSTIQQYMPWVVPSTIICTQGKWARDSKIAMHVVFVNNKVQYSSKPSTFCFLDKPRLLKSHLSWKFLPKSLHQNGNKVICI